MEKGMKYAYGFIDHFFKDQRYVGHSGGVPGISAEFRMFRDSEYTVIVLSNYNRIAGAVFEKIRELITC